MSEALKWVVVLCGIVVFTIVGLAALVSWDDLLFASHTIEDASTGEKFKRYRGEVLDAVNLPITAWAITPDGPLFLEPV